MLLLEAQDKIKQLIKPESKLEVNFEIRGELYNSFKLHVGNPMYPLICSSFGQLPGCCGAALSYNTRVETSLRGQGIGSQMLEIHIKAAKEILGYSLLMRTSVLNSEGATPDNKFDPVSIVVEQHLLEKNKFKLIHEFKNKRTGNIIGTFVKDLLAD